LLEGEPSFAFFCPFFYIPHPLDAPDVVGRGLDGSIEELNRILDRGGNLAKQQARNIEKFVRGVFAKKAPTKDPDERDWKQDQELSKGEINALDKAKHNAEQMKADIVGKKNGSKYDLYKDKQGNIYVKPKGGQAPGEPTGYNINDLI
jgi:Bacterial toxin 33